MYGHVITKFVPWEDYHISIAMALGAALGAPLKTERDLLGINIAQGFILKKLWTKVYAAIEKLRNSFLAFLL